MNVIKVMMEIDSKLFEEVSKKVEQADSDEKKVHKKNQDMWSALEAAIKD